MKQLFSIGALATFLCCYLQVFAGGGYGGGYGGGSNMSLQGAVQDNTVCNGGIPNCQCDGKMRSLSVIYIGQSGATVKVYKSNSYTSGNLITTFTGAQNGQTLIVSAAGIGGQFQSCTYFVIAGGSSNCNNSDQINTSCSASIIGKTYGSFKVVGYTDGAGNQCSLSVCDGSIDLSVSGGTGPYTYNWSNGSTSQDVTNLCSGTYCVTVKDKNCGTSTKSFTVGQAASGISVTAATTPDAACQASSCYNNQYSSGGSCSGSITITVAGGASPYTYKWSNNKTTKDLTGVCGGTYVVTVTDANGCYTTKNVTVNEVVTNISITASTTSSATCQQNSSCYNNYYHYNHNHNQNSGSCNGSINISVSGGAAPYTYRWSNNKTTEDQSSVCAGNYSVTVTDANGCTQTKSVCVGQTVTNISLSATTTPNSACSQNLCNGTISLTVSGGVAPLSYSWSNGSSNEDPSGVCAGNYSVTVTDANGCTASKTVCVQQIATTISLSATTTNDASCTPGVNCTGSINLTVSGGSAPYSYAWSGNMTGEDPANVCAGAYTVTVTDANGCTATKNVTVGQTNVSTSCSISGAASTCPAAVNSYSGGINADAYSWSVTGNATIDGVSNQASVSILAGNSCGQYVVQLSATKTGCTAVCTYTVQVVDQVPPVISGVGANQTIDCTAQPQFSAATASDNCAQNPSLVFNDETIAGACPQSYSIKRTWTATDACGNTSTASQTITFEDRTAPAVSVSQVAEQIQCPAVPVFGILTIADNCDPSPATSFEDDTIAGSCASEYTVIRTWMITDACGNSSSASQSVSVQDTTPPAIVGVGSDMTIACPAQPQFSSPIAEDICGQATLSFTDDTVAGSCANQYTIVRQFIAVDACGNSSSASQAITIVDMTPPVIAGIGADKTVACSDSIKFSEPAATDECGSVSLSFEDVTMPGNCANEYVITRTWNATDACGNSSSASQSITVEDNEAPVISGVGQDATIECPAQPQFSEPVATDACGSATLLFEDVTMPGNCANEYVITRTWNATDACGNSSSASQSITVEDNDAPIISGVGADATIECPAQPQFSEPVATDACGSATLSFEDVTMPGNCANEYVITRTWNATDVCGNSSSASQSITVEDNDAPIISGVGADATIECPAQPQFSEPVATDACGSATLSFEEDTLFENAPDYIVYVRTWKAADACGNESAEVSQKITVLNAHQPASGSNPSCHSSCNGMASVSGACYAYSWSTGATTATIENLCEGVYTVTMTDAFGFQILDTVELTAPEALALDTIVTHVTCFGASDGAVNLIVSGGTAPYTYSWSHGVFTEDISGLIAGTYSVTVTDSHDCKASVVIIIRQPSELTLGAIPTPASCHGANDGEITLTVSGSVPPYTYQWSNGATTKDISGLAAGTYQVTVADAHLCHASLTVHVGEPQSIIITSVITQEGCEHNTGAIDITVSGGTLPYSYSWSNGATTEDISGLNGGDYSVTVTDFNECSAVKNMTVDTSTVTHCNISGNATVCPHSMQQYTSAAAANYSWSVSGNAMIVGSSDEQSVSVQTTDCGQFSLTLVVSGADCASTCTYEVSVVDTEAPAISGVGADETIECPATPVFSEPVAVDGCGNATLTFEDDTIAGACASEYVVIRSWTATDACGNSSHASQAITVADNTAPVISGVAQDETIDCPSMPQFSQPSASDICGNATLTFEDEITFGDCMYQIAVTRVWTATDACGNVATASQTITIEDKTVPVISGVAQNETIECPAQPVFSQPTAFDSCDEQPWLSFEDSVIAGNCANEYTVIRTWTAVDACGNSSSASQAITVIDNSSPVISGVGQSETIECPAQPVFSEPTASDVCGSATLTFEDVIIPGSCANEYSVIRQWTATDACGNSSSASQTITVIDNSSPVISGIGQDETIECPAQPVFSEPAASDACGSATLTFEDVTIPGSCVNEYTLIRQWTAVDACGNSSSASQAITVVDHTAPEISGMTGDQTLECPALPEFANPVAADACGAAALTFVDDITFGDCAYNFSITRIWTATDACGNSSTASQTINAGDHTAPVINGVGADMTINCPAQPQFSEPVASDGCSDAFLSYENDTIFDGAPEMVVYVRTWYANDACGNEATAVSQRITVLNLHEPAVGVNPLCHASCDGSVTVNGACYSYLWSTGDMTALVENLCAGTYMVTMTDMFGFEIADTVVLTAPDAIELQSSVTHVNCFGGNEGAIDLTVSGGVLPYTFIWSNGASTEDISGLTAGIYSVTVIDAHGCSDLLAAEVESPSEIGITLSKTNVSCRCQGSNDCILNYNDLQHGEFINSQFAARGIHIYGDANNRIDTLIVFNTFSTGTADPDLEVDLGNILILPHTIADNNHDGLVDSPNDWANGGKQIYVFDNARSIQSFLFIDNDQPVPGSATAYDAFNNVIASVAVPTTADGGSVIVNMNVSGVRRLEIQYNGSGGVGEMVFCDQQQQFTCCDATAAATVSGGVAPYTFAWSNGSTDASVDSLCEGIYALTVIDARGCQKDTFVTILKDTGCVNPCDVVSCNDFDACTIDECANGACSNTAILCDDLNSCTTDACVNGQCSFTAIICDDQDACTTDECISGQCSFTATNCDDSNECTEDACINGVCSNTLIPNCGCVAEITGFTLVDAETDADVSPLTDGMLISRDAVCKFNIRADYCGNRVESVRFILNGNTSRIEETEPFALAGDNPNGNYHAWNAVAGVYTIKAVPHSGPYGTGTAGIALTITVTVTDGSGMACGCNDNNPCTADAVVNGHCTHTPVILTSTRSISVCNGDSVYAGGAYQTTGGTYFDTLASASGCDSVVETNLTVYKKIEVTHESTDVTENCSNPQQDLCVLNFANLPHGTVLTGEEYAAYGIHISAIAYPNTWTNTPNIQQLVIFNTFATGTFDHDLQVGIGNIAIFPENLTDADSNGLVDMPNDTRWGGQQIYTFDFDRTIVSVTIVDHDRPGGTITAYDANNNVIVTVAIPTLADGTVAVVPVNATGARKLVVDDNDSGGLTDIVFDCTSECCNGTAEVSVAGGTAPFSYHWSNGASSSSVDSLCEGTYFITVTDVNGCVGLDTVIINAAPRIALRNMQNEFENVSVYPVPFDNTLMVDFIAKEDGPAEIRLLNLLGQAVETENVLATKGQNKKVMNVQTELQQGVYFVELAKNGYSEGIRVLKVK